MYKNAYELVGPIRPAQKEYKLLLSAYLSLRNFPDELSSHINNIRLTAVYTENYLFLDKFHEEIVKDFKIIKKQKINVDRKIINDFLSFIIGNNNYLITFCVRWLSCLKKKI